MKNLLLLLLIAPVLGFGQIGSSTSVSDKITEIGSINLYNAMGTVNGKAKHKKRIVDSATLHLIG